MIVSAQPLILRDSIVQTLAVQFKSRREAKGEPVDAIADLLLISKSQVRGLESGNVKAFYSARHFVQIARKYCNYLNIEFPENLIAEGVLIPGDVAVLPVPEPEQVVTTPAPATEHIVTTPKPQPVTHTPLLDTHNPGNKTSTQKPPRSKAVSYAIALLSVILLGTVLLDKFDWQTAAETLVERTTALLPIEKTETAPSESAKNAEPTAPPAAEEATPQIQPPSQEGASKAAKLPIVLETSGTCWVQLNYADGRKLQKIYPAKSQIEFDKGELAGMLIGDLNAATLTIDGKQIDLRRYQKPDSNVARLLGKDAEVALDK